MLKHLKKHKTKPARVVILGSGGFVSGAVETKLKSLEVPVFALPRKELDLTSETAGLVLASILRTDDTILFVSAKAPVKNEAMLIENLHMAKSVCEAIKKSAVSHMVYISSDAVYADSDKPMTETSCAQPASLHGAMHLAREVMLANCFDGPLCILRPTLIHGEGDPHNGYGPNRFMRLVKAGDDIQLFGNGEEKRDHVWISDVAEIVTLAILFQSKGILNIASGEENSFRDIAEKLVSLTDSSSQIFANPRIGSMPHNGYRAFEVSATRLAFPDFEYKKLFTVLGKSNAR
jgi:UDP-glucose 4-epimerase